MNNGDNHKEQQQEVEALKCLTEHLHSSILVHMLFLYSYIRVCIHIYIGIYIYIYTYIWLFILHIHTHRDMYMASHF